VKSRVEQIISLLPRYNYIYISIGGRTNYIQHHASLNLAVLYYGFGHLDQALRSLEETVRLAQQNGSSECLLHAIALLATISSAKGCRWDTAHAFRLLNRCVQSNMAAEAGRNKKSEASEEKENKTEHKQSDSALGIYIYSTWFISHAYLHIWAYLSSLSFYFLKRHLLY